MALPPNALISRPGSSAGSVTDPLKTTL